MTLSVTPSHGYSLGELFQALDNEKASSPALQMQMNALEKALTSNVTSARQESIEIMLQLALRTDAVGQDAENRLFRVFSDEAYIRNGLSQDIGQKSLKLFEMADAAPKTADIFTTEKLSTPSKLLYMAGDEAASKKYGASAQKIGQIFLDGKSTQQLLTIENQDQFLAPASLWHSNRFCTNIELSIMAKRFPDQKKDMSGNNSAAQAGSSAHAVPPAKTDIEIHATLTVNDLSNLDKRKPPIITPMWERNHFFLVYISDDKNALCFSSLPDYMSATEEALKNKGMNVISIEDDLQTHAPNACALFVLEIMKKIFNSPHNSDINQQEREIRKFIEDFRKLPDLDQAAFNTSRRREVIGTFLENSSKSFVDVRR